MDLLSFRTELSFSRWPPLRPPEAGSGSCLALPLPSLFPPRGGREAAPGTRSGAFQRSLVVLLMSSLLERAVKCHSKGQERGGLVLPAGRARGWQGSGGRRWEPLCPQGALWGHEDGGGGGGTSALGDDYKSWQALRQDKVTPGCSVGTNPKRIAFLGALSISTAASRRC